VPAIAGKKTEKRKHFTLSTGQSMGFIAVCTLLGLALRIAMARRGSLWCDEAQFLWIVRMPTLRAMIEFLWQHESHPPLFYMLMRGWLGVFGDSELAALSLPILLGTALIPAAHYVANRVFSSYTGPIAAALITASPVLANYSGQVRPYSLLPLLCLTSVYLMWRGLGGGGGARIWAAQAVISLAMLLTHNWAWMVFGAEASVVAICLLAGRLSSTIFGQWLVAQIVVIAGYAPWVRALLYQVRNAGYGPRSVNLIEAISIFAEMMTSLPWVVVAWLTLPLIVVAATQVRYRSARENIGPFLDTWGFALLLFAGIPVIAFATAVFLSYRNNLCHRLCLITLTPCIIVVMAFLISSRSSWPRLLCGLLVSTYLLSSLELLGWKKANAAALAEAVAARAEQSDIVVITPCWHASSFDHYFKLKNLQIVYPYNVTAGAIAYDRLGRRLLSPEPMTRLRAEIDRAYQEGRRLWLVKSGTIAGIPRIASESDAFPQEKQNFTYVELGYSRANQITEIIESKFGKSADEICPCTDRPGNEIVRAFLYRRVRSDNKVEPDGPLVADPPS
jgi:4-amino-4-deoxy-L-arabinose transferase-like glycosyltransferase